MSIAKKVLLFLIGLALAVSPVFGLQKDFIVLLDTSESMFDDYDQVVNVFFDDVLKEHLRVRDHFHLISFAEKPELEITQKIESRENVEIILKRLLLLQPLGKYTDLILALNFTNQYARGLAPNLPKTVMILSDGEHNPPNGQNRMEPEKATAEVAAQLKAMKDNGWDVRFIRIPAATVAGASSAEQTGPPVSKPSGDKAETETKAVDMNLISKNLAFPLYDYQEKPDFSNLALGSPTVAFPENLGKIGRTFYFPLNFENFNDTGIVLRLREILFKGKNILKDRTTVALSGNEKKSTSFLLEFAEKAPDNGEQSAVFSLVFDDEMRAFPTEGKVFFTYSDGWEGWGVAALWGLGVLLAAGLLIALIVLFRKLFAHGQRMAEQGLSRVSSVTSSPIVSSQEAAFSKAAPSPPRAVPGLGAPLVNSGGVSRTREPLGWERPVKESLPPTAKTSEKRLSELPLAKTTKTFDFPPSRKEEITFPAAFQKSASQTDFLSALEKKAETGRQTESLPEAFRKKASALATDFIIKTSSDHGNGGRSDLVPSGKQPHLPTSRARLIQSDKLSLEPQDFCMTVWTRDRFFQNTEKHKNVLALKPGELRSVGGLQAQFKILIFKVEKVLAEVEFDGEVLRFIPIVMECFPQLSGPLADCVDQDILLRLSPALELRLCFSRYVTETQKVNSFLNRNR